jgi:hypothetical protein
MKFSPTSSHLVSLWSKYSPRHPFLKHPVYVRFEVFSAVTMKKAVFWDVAACRCVNRRFGGTYRLHLQGRSNGNRGKARNQREQVLTD